MRFYVLSDLHLSSSEEKHNVTNRIRKLCAKIRSVANIDELILFIILGDIADKGNAGSFVSAHKLLSLILEELKDYYVKFEFVPGNHDLSAGSLEHFDNLISEFGSCNRYEISSVYSNVYDGVNFIFADSTLSKDYAAPGRIDLNAIINNVKVGLINILFCHHAISHGHGDVHDTIEDSATVLAKLNSVGISYFFHGHVHDANVTIPLNGIVEIGCGSISGDISWFESVYHQFTIGYIHNKKILSIERWIDTQDGHGGFAYSRLYPKPREFADPDSIDKITHPIVDNYIQRTVSSYEEANKNHYLRLIGDNNQINLKEAVLKHKKILLLCDAGVGKSIELKQLAYIMSDKYHTFLYFLEDYAGEDICDLLPDAYKNISPNHMVLIFDGYDELNGEYADKFKIKIKIYEQEAPGIKIVISSRSNFCGNENSNKSLTFNGFSVFVLNKLSPSDISEYLSNKGIDGDKFEECVHVKGVSDLVDNPFYLIELADIYAQENTLPSKKQLMDKIIEKTFDVDDSKFLGNLGDRYYELFLTLEMLAVAMQTMHLQAIEDRTEYQKLFNLDERDLIKKSGLLKREGSHWRFSHNNFREYLVARCFSRLSKEIVVSMIYDGVHIKHYWVNTLGYLTGFDLEWNLIDWLLEKAPTAIVKFEPDRLNTEERINAFYRVFDRVESLRTHFNDDLCDEIELAHFAHSNEVVSFLINKIANPSHFVSQYTAVNILRNSPDLRAKDKEVRDVLIECCENYPTTHKTICRLAMAAIYQHNLQTEEITQRLMQKFADVDEDYIRLGLYEYLMATKQHDVYVEYCLSGIKFITYKFDDDNSRIGNESFVLVNCLKNMSTVDSVKSVLEWLSKERNTDFHGFDDVLESNVISAVKLYLNGHTELFDFILSIYIEAAKSWNTQLSTAMVKFFIETGTQYIASSYVTVEFEHEVHRFADLIYADITIIEYLKSEYINGNLKSHLAFREIINWYVKNEKEYMVYAKLIKEVDGVDIPEYKEPIDYDAIKRVAEQEYFDSLFDEVKRSELYLKLINKIDNPDLQANQILDIKLYGEHHSPVRHLQSAIYRYGGKIKVTEFFDKINMDNFIIWSASQFLSKNSTLVVSIEQKEQLKNIVGKLLDTNTFKNCVKYYPNGCEISELIKELLIIIRYLDYTLDEETMLDLTEIPAFVFNKSNDEVKYDYITQRLSIEKIKARLIKNIEAQSVKDMVLNDHIEFFDAYKDPSIAGYALEICKNTEESYLRSASWRYLYNVFGAEYIASEILPIADQELLLEISNNCKGISREKLRLAMEKEYSSNYNVNLQAHLIILSSSIAINDYVTKVTRDKCTPEGKEYSMGGPTEAISSIKDPIFLPQLESLLIAVFDPEFSDRSLRGLRNTLVKAFTNVGVRQYEETMNTIMKNRPNADKDEINYRYCNYIIEDIERAKKSSSDVPRTIVETKELIDEIRKLS